MLNRLYTTALSIVCLFIYSSVVSQDFVYKHYNLQDGLPNPTIHAIFQDKDGFMWFATESGLSRYDGRRFRTYTVEDGLPGNEVMGMFQDSKGRMWMHFYRNNIAYLYKGKIYNQENDSLLRQFKFDSRVMGISEDKQGNIGFCNLSFMYIISPTGKVIRKVQSAMGNTFIGMTTNKEGDFLIQASKSVYELKHGKLNAIRQLQIWGNGIGPAQFVLHSNFYAYYGVDTIYLRDTTVAIGNYVVNQIKYSPVCDSILSLNTSDGCHLFYINDLRMVKLLPGRAVSNVFMDVEKNIWIGTIGEGLFKLSSQAIIRKKLQDGPHEIWFITKDKHRVLAGSNDSELFGFSGNGPVTKYRLSDILTKPGNKVLYYESQGKDSYMTADGTSLSLVKNNKLVLSSFVSILKQVSPYDNEHLLLALYPGVVIMRKKDFVVLDTVWRQRSLSVFKTGDSVLVGTTAGIFVCKKINGQYRAVDSLLLSSNITYIKQTSNGLIWICTVEDGLYCIGGGKIVKHFNKKTGLPSNNGRTLYTRGNEVWLGTDKGLVKIVEENEKIVLKKFSTSDGLPSNVINSVYTDGDTVYVGSTEGLCYFKEDAIQTNSICNLVLTAATVGNSLSGISNNYVIGANQRFTVEFSGISFRSEQETSYRYRINGLDDGWRNTDLGSLEFSSLPGGDYELEIVAINKFGVESKPLKLALHVKKPLHKTTWFLALIIIVPVLALAYAYNRRVHAIRKQQLQKLEQQVKVIKLEQMALRAQMNPHFIFNCINVIQQLVEEKDRANTHKFITSFSELVRQTLDNAPELFIKLSDEIKFLTNYFELERIRLEDRFSYVIDSAGIEDPAQWKVPNMVIQPFVENAIRHGIRYKKDGPGFIEVRFEQKDGSLRCTITDNGIGREKAAELRKESGVWHASRAMGITSRRIESLNALNQGKISIHIEDLKDEKGIAAGTKVIIEFFRMAEQ